MRQETEFVISVLFYTYSIASVEYSHGIAKGFKIGLVAFLGQNREK